MSKLQVRGKTVSERGRAYGGEGMVHPRLLVGLLLPFQNEAIKNRVVDDKEALQTGIGVPIGHHHLQLVLDNFVKSVKTYQLSGFVSLVLKALAYKRFGELLVLSYLG